VLARLAAHLDDPKWSIRQREQVESFAGDAGAMGLHASAWLQSADWLLHPPTHLVITGAAGDPAADAMHRAALAAVFPRRVVRRLLPEEGAAGLPPELRAMLQGGDAVRGYLCRGAQCEAPVDGIEEWQELLDRVSRRSELSPT
jgi:uncharacterized protein YyaL (SSP411 family)